MIKRDCKNSGRKYKQRFEYLDDEALNNICDFQVHVFNPSALPKRWYGNRSDTPNLLKKSNEIFYFSK
jgi:hypothetical protein